MEAWIIKKKKKKGNLWGWWMCSLLMWDSFRDLYMFQNLSSCTLYICSLLNENYISIKMFVKEHIKFIKSITHYSLFTYYMMWYFS